MKIVGIALALIVSAQPVLALSCLPRTIGDAYADAVASDSRYRVVAGRVTFNPARLPDNQINNGPPPSDTYIPAHLNGLSMSNTGFDLEYRQRITMNVRCFGDFCASMTDGANLIAFIQETRRGPLMVVEPCTGFVFADTPETRAQVLSCHQGNTCPKGEFSQPEN